MLINIKGNLKRYDIKELIVRVSLRYHEITCTIAYRVLNYSTP
jgi:hypothetical protein